MAHPVRPDEYLEINNFYTTTVYEKGAEVIRMQHTLLGAERVPARHGPVLRSGTTGRRSPATTSCRRCRTRPGVDLAQFRRWYAQAGTPVVTVARHATTPRATHLHARRRAAHAADARASPPSCRSTSRSPSAWSAPTAATCRCALAGEAAPRGTTRVLRAARAAAVLPLRRRRRSRRCRRCCADSRRR